MGNFRVFINLGMVLKYVSTFMPPYRVAFLFFLHAIFYLILTYSIE